MREHELSRAQPISSGMEHDLSDFGTGLLAHLRRSPHWVPDRRELVRIPWAPASEEPHAQRTTLLALAPLVAAFVAALAS
jgi:hypothetical protein